MPFTADGLFYPDDTNNFNLTQHLQDLADDIQAVFNYQETWNSWTPAFNNVVNGGFTSMGTGGHAWGHYRRTRSGSGALLYAEFHFLCGTGVTVQTAGSTDSLFVLLLPVTAYLWAGQNQNQTVGRWSARNNTPTISGNPVEHHSGTLGLYDTSDGGRVHFADGVDSSAAINSGRRMDENDPFTFAVNDILSGQLLYRVS
jgi:hypothetical protein